MRRSVRGSRIGSRSVGVHTGYGRRRQRQLVAEFRAAVQHIPFGDGDLVGRGGHAAPLQIRLVQPLRADAGHREVLVHVLHRGRRHGRPLGLHGFHTLHAGQRLDVVIAQSRRRGDLDVVEPLPLVEPSRRYEGATAPGVDARQHRDAEHGDDRYRCEPFRIAQRGAPGVLGICAVPHDSALLYHSMSATGVGEGFRVLPVTLPLRKWITWSAMGAIALLCVMMMTVIPSLRLTS